MKILIVDSSKIYREKLIRYLELEKYFENVLEAGTEKKAEGIIQKGIIEVLLFDIQLPDNSGLDLIPFSNRQLNRPLLILCSNYCLPQYKKTYESLSVHHFFDKSSELGKLKLFIRELVEERNVFTKN